MVHQSTFRLRSLLSVFRIYFAYVFSTPIGEDEGKYLGTRMRISIVKSPLLLPAVLYSHSFDVVLIIFYISESFSLSCFIESSNRKE